MADTAQYIGDLNIASPADSESRKVLGASDRQIKKAAKQSFPYVTGEVTATHTELSYTDGVTSNIQTQLNTKAPTASPTFTGTPAAPTATSGDSSTQVATTAFVAAAIAGVNATTGLAYSNDDSTSVAVSVGQHKQCRNAAAVAVTWPTGTTVGQLASVSFDNGLFTNTIDFGAQSIKGASGVVRSGVVNWNLLGGLRAVWGGEYWRALP